MSIKRVFLGTSAPLPELAAKKLTENCGKLPDFGNVIFAVPGNYARTAFQEALTALVPGGLFEPQIMTPGVLLHCGTEKKKLPDNLENELIWNKTALNAAKSGCFDLLFPGYHDGMNISGAAFSHLRLELSAGGFSIADAQEHLGTRGKQLAELEKLYLKELADQGFDDRLAADIQAVEDIGFFEQYDKIILCGLVDLPRLLQKRVENIAEMYPGKVEAWIFADSSKADCFDHAGCAIPEKWNDVPIEFDDFENNVHCVDSFDDAAEKLTELFEMKNDLFFDETAIVLADPAMYPNFRRKLADWAKKQDGKLDLYDPSGIMFSELRIHKLLNLLLAFCKSRDDVDNAVQLIKNQDFLAYLSNRLGRKKTTILKELDKFLVSALPTEFANALSYLADNESEYPLAYQIFSCIAEIPEKYQTNSIAFFLRDFLTCVYQKRKSSELSLYLDVPFSKECILIQESLEKLEKININSDFSRDEVFELFCKQLGEEKLSAVPSENAIAVQGCLELPFLHEKNIFFCGISSSCYPDRIAPALYLTDTIRSKIGIRSNKETFSRAAAHLHSLCQTAKNNVNIHFITTRRDKSGEPLSPSPLFFTGELSEQQLLKRCRKFFKDVQTFQGKSGKWKSEYSYFTLSPQLDYRTHEEYQDIPVLSVTSFASYIKNPLDYFLSREMHMSEINYLSKEPDAVTFGNIVHETFNKFGTAVCRSVEEYQKQLTACLNEIMSSRYGRNPSGLIEVIRENILQRLEYASEFMFKSSKEEHFIPLETEFILGGEEKMIACHITKQPVPDVFLKGIIDRIEYSPERNLLRVIDFKTGSKSDIQKKLSPYTDKKHSKIKLTDLQMPLYVDLLRMDKNFAARHQEIDMQNVKIECAYFTLPKSVSDTEILVWQADELEDIIDYAWQKVLDIIGEIKNWKSREMSEKGLKSKEFPSLFLPDVRSCLKDIHWITPIEEEYSCK